MTGTTTCRIDSLAVGHTFDTGADHCCIVIDATSVPNYTPVAGKSYYLNPNNGLVSEVDGGQQVTPRKYDYTPES